MLIDSDGRNAQEWTDVDNQQICKSFLLELDLLCIHSTPTSDKNGGSTAMLQSSEQ